MKRKEWGADFSHIIYNPSNETVPPTSEDIDYILSGFLKAVKKRGLTAGGGAKTVRLDILTCEKCYKNEALNDCEYCAGCLDKVARRHGYAK